MGTWWIRANRGALVGLACLSGSCADVWGFQGLIGIGDGGSAEGAANGDATTGDAGDSGASVDAGGDSGPAAGEAGGAGDSAVPGSETGPAEAGAPSDAQTDVGGSTDAQAAIDAVTADVEAPDAAMGVCTPTATQCTSNTQVETCGSDGQWGAPTTCQYACVDDAGGACGGVCMPGATQCSGESVETCSSEGQWETTTCSGGMTCSTSTGMAACACPSGETDCSGTCETACPGTCPAGSGLYWCAERDTCTTAADCN
jgi:hypothetical protein